MPENDPSESPAPTTLTLPALPFLEFKDSALIETSAEFGSIAAALAQAQTEFPDIPKDKTAKVTGKTGDGRRYEYTYQYADIADVLKAVRPILGKHGIAVVQPVSHDPEGFLVTVRSTLLHESNQWISCALSITAPPPRAGSAAQQIGGFITYFRRYTLASLVGVATDEDTDQNQPNGGEEAPKKERTPRASRSELRQEEGCISPEQQQELRQGLGLLDLPEGDLLKHVSDAAGGSIRVLRKIPAEHYDTASNWISAKLDENASSD